MLERLSTTTTMPWPAELPSVPVGRSAKHPLRVGYLRALLSCDAVSEELPLVVDGTRRPSRAMSEHLQSCLSCQAELARYRHLLRVLKSLSNEPVGSTAPSIGEEGWRAIRECLEARSRACARWRLAGCLALIAAALGGGAAIVRATRQARLLPALHRFLTPV